MFLFDTVNLLVNTRSLLADLSIEVDVLFTNTKELPKHFWLRTEDPDVLVDLDNKFELEKAMDPRSSDQEWVMTGVQGYFRTKQKNLKQ